MEASVALSYGGLREELKGAARDRDVTTLVVGTPAGEERAFSAEDLKAFVAELEAETGVQAYVSSQAVSPLGLPR